MKKYIEKKLIKFFGVEWSKSKPLLWVAVNIFLFNGIYNSIWWPIVRAYTFVKFFPFIMANKFCVWFERNYSVISYGKHYDVLNHKKFRQRK